MTEEKRFKIKEIKKYEGQLNNSKDSLIFSCLVIACCFLGQYSDYCKGNLEGMKIFGYWCGYLLHFIGLAGNIKGRKQIKDKLEQLKEEFGPFYEQYLEEYNQDMNNGRSR